MRNLNSNSPKNQLTLDQQSLEDLEQEFQSAHIAFFESTNEAEYQEALIRMDAARSKLVLTFGYSLEKLAALVDSDEGVQHKENE